MKIDLKKYMAERDKLRVQSSKPGPVLTLSRQYGCEANKIAIKLLGKIADMKQGSIIKSQWRYINKEVIDEAAKELHLPVERIEQRLTTDHKAVNDIFGSFSHHYIITDKKIIETIKNILNTYIQKGNLIIIGRGGAQFTQKVKDSISVKLHAPLDWRISHISKVKKITEREAAELIDKVDKSRITWSEKITGIKYSDDLFDLSVNRKTLTEDQIVNLILSLMIQKSFI